MKKWFIALLPIAAAMLLASCQGNITETTAPDTAQEPVSSVTLISEGMTEYKMIRPENSSKKITDAFAKLKSALNSKYGVTMTLEDDFEKPGTDPATRHPFEILVGNTNRDESKAALEGVGYDDSVIAVKGDRVVISGGNDDAVVRAVDLFIEKYLTGAELSLAGDLNDITRSEYAKPDVTLEGAPLGEYTLVYASAQSDYANEIAYRLGMLTGARLNVVPEKNAPAEKAILIKINAAGKTLGPDDFTILSSGSSLTVTGSNKTSLGMSCAEFVEILSDERTSYKLSDLTLEYSLPESRDYINDIFSLPMHWAFEFQTPEWMLDFEEKCAATLDTGGRLMSCAHRGDMVYYPENSIEGIISAILMGCDMIEIDPRLTKDGVFVLLHDETLSRTTNVAELAGKNGLPTSYKVSDWTYEQLMQLNLKEKTGGADAKLTPYKIPTLEEAIKVSAGRIFVRLDVKGPENSSTPFWDYKRDIWPLLEKYDAYSNVIYTWHSWFKSGSYSIPVSYRAKAEKLGFFPAPVFVSDSGSLSAILKTANTYGFNPGVRIGSDFSKYSYKTYLAENAEKLSSYKNNLRTYADVHGTNSAYPENQESYEYYAALYEGGINYYLVNKALLLCSYIAENFEPTPVQ